MTSYTQGDLIGVNEAAKILGLTRQGVQDRINRGLLTPVSRLGKRRVAVLDRAVVEAQAEKRRARGKK